MRCSFPIQRGSWRRLDIGLTEQLFLYQVPLSANTTVHVVPGNDQRADVLLLTFTHSCHIDAGSLSYSTYRLPRETDVAISIAGQTKLGKFNVAGNNNWEWQWIAMHQVISRREALLLCCDVVFLSRCGPLCPSGHLAQAIGERHHGVGTAEEWWSIIIQRPFRLR